MDKIHSILYKNIDSFTIEKKLGDIHYFTRILKSCVEKYGISSPNLKELTKIVQNTQAYMKLREFDDALGYPIYPMTDFLCGVQRVTDTLLKNLLKIKDSSKMNKKFLNSIIDKYENEEESFSYDCMSR